MAYEDKREYHRTAQAIRMLHRYSNRFHAVDRSRAMSAGEMSADDASGTPERSRE